MDDAYSGTEVPITELTPVPASDEDYNPVIPSSDPLYQRRMTIEELRDMLRCTAANQQELDGLTTPGLLQFHQEYETALALVADRSGYDLHCAYNRLAQTYQAELEAVSYVARDWVDGKIGFKRADRETLRSVFHLSIKWAGSENWCRISTQVTVQDLTDGLFEGEGEDRMHRRDKRGIAFWPGNDLDEKTQRKTLAKLVDAGFLDRIDWRYKSVPNVGYRLGTNWPALLAAVRLWRQDHPNLTKRLIVCALGQRTIYFGDLLKMVEYTTNPDNPWGLPPE